MNDGTVQKLVALTFLFLGAFLILDQVSILLGLDISTIVRALIILAGVVSIVTALVLFAAKSSPK